MSALIAQIPTMAAATPRTKYAAFIQDFRPILGDKVHEDRVAYLYLDSYGHLTVGVGHLVARHGSHRSTVRQGIADIFKYNFTYYNPLRLGFAQPVRHSQPGLINFEGGAWNTAMSTPASFDLDHLTPGVWGSPAPTTQFTMSFPTIDEVTNEAMKLMAMKIVFKHFKGAYYAQFDRYALSEDGIDDLAFEDMLTIIGQLTARQQFKDFDVWPLSAEQAVLDLAFQYGVGGLHRHTDFSKAVAGQHWKQAAQVVPGGVSGDRRTDWRVNQLLAAQ